jgi:hypothetical protein
MYQLKEIIVHFRNICQHSHDENIRSVVEHYRKRMTHNFKQLFEAATKASTKPSDNPRFLLVKLPHPRSRRTFRTWRERRRGESCC